MSSTDVAPTSRPDVKIAHLANLFTATSGGLRTTVRALGRGYRGRGHQMVLIVPGPRDRVTDEDFGRMITLRSPLLPKSGGYRMILDRRRVARILDRLEPDVLEVSDRFTLRPLGRWANARGIPSVFFAHERLDGLMTVRGMPAQLARRLADIHNRSTVEAFDTIVATTRYAAQEFLRIGAPHIAIVPLGVDARPAMASPSADGTITQLLLCSRLSKEKRPDIAIDALRELLRRGISANLTIAGDGPMKSSLVARAATLPVRFLGHVADRDRLSRLQSAVDLMLAPGPIETFGLSALESLAAGTSVVVSNSSALTEVIGDNPAVGRPASIDPARFADAVEGLLQVPGPIRASAARARAAEFPWTSTTDRMIALHSEHVP